MKTTLICLLLACAASAATACPQPAYKCYKLVLTEKPSPWPDPVLARENLLAQHVIKVLPRGAVMPATRN